jgi:hypothetical protein
LKYFLSWLIDSNRSVALFESEEPTTSQMIGSGTHCS